MPLSSDGSNALYLNTGDEELQPGSDLRSWILPQNSVQYPKETVSTKDYVEHYSNNALTYVALGASEIAFRKLDVALSVLKRISQISGDLLRQIWAYCQFSLTNRSAYQCLRQSARSNFPLGDFAEVCGEDAMARTDEDLPKHNDFHPAFTCQMKECCGGQAFRRRCELERHMDKRNRPYICSKNECHVRRFADKGGFHRHNREIHGDDGAGHAVKVFPCPFKACRKSRTDFRRKWNLQEHMRRVHDTPNSAPALRSRARSASDCDDAKAVMPASSPQEIPSGTAQELMRQALRDEIGKLRLEKAEVDEEGARIEQDKARLDGKIAAFVKVIDEL
ncbi:hypothetical protein MMC13_003793 [Lambiella insularis]|nr:hypothetical protein [Lambiella insularis]